MEEPVINERERAHAAELVAEHEPIREWWYRESALLSCLLNAGSTTIPDGERFIVRAVDDAQKLVQDEDLKRAAQTLIHEETAHACVHDAYNRYLAAQGFPAEKYIAETQRTLAYFEKRFTLLERLAVCAMIEHFTALFGKQLLENGLLEGEDVDERLDRVWSWHALEEIEHRSTAIDLYRALGGGYFTRIRVATLTSIIFAYSHTRCMFAYLNAKHVLGADTTWRNAWGYILGKKGVYRLFLTDWVRIYYPGFHPKDISIENRIGKQLHHYHIENDLVEYFADTPISA